jgi:hypothetical protein
MHREASGWSRRFQSIQTLHLVPTRHVWMGRMLITRAVECSALSCPLFPDTREHINAQIVAAAEGRVRIYRCSPHCCQHRLPDVSKDTPLALGPCALDNLPVTGAQGVDRRSGPATIHDLDCGQSAPKVNHLGAGHWQVARCARPQSQRGGLRHVRQASLTTMGQAPIDPYTTVCYYLHIDMFLSARAQGTRDKGHGTRQGPAFDSAGDPTPYSIRHGESIRGVVSECFESACSTHSPLGASLCFR